MESALITHIVSTLTDYQHVRNATEKASKLISFDQIRESHKGNECFSWNIDPDNPLQAIAPSQRTTLWDKMK